MGFWIFMFFSELLIPLILLGFGRYFMKHAPKEINHVFGYRTGMSMKNKETWEFAHHYFGKIWFYSGIVMLAVSIIVMILTVGQDNNTVGGVGLVLCFLQMFSLIGSIVPTEIALKKTFDKNGNRR